MTTNIAYLSFCVATKTPKIKQLLAISFNQDFNI